MAVFRSAVLTERGNELLVDAVAGKKIRFTRMVVGAGEYTEAEKERNALEKATALKDQRQEFTFSAHEKASPTCVRLTAVISNKGLLHGYKITEIGIYGKNGEDGDGGDFLCSIAVANSTGEADTLPPYNGLLECQVVEDYFVTLSPDAEVSVETKGATILREEYDQFRDETIARQEGLEKKKLDRDGDGSEITVNFTQAAHRQNIESGSKLSTIMGIIRKVFADLKAAAFASVADNLLTTENGTVLDGKQGKILYDMIGDVRQAFTDGCNTIVAGCTTYGATPEGNSPPQIVDAIAKIYADRYEQGKGAGRVSMRCSTGTYGLQGSEGANESYTYIDVSNFKKLTLDDFGVEGDVAGYQNVRISAGNTTIMSGSGTDVGGYAGHVFDISAYANITVYVSAAYHYSFWVGLTLSN